MSAVIIIISVFLVVGVGSIGLLWWRLAAGRVAGARFEPELEAGHKALAHAEEHINELEARIEALRVESTEYQKQVADLNARREADIEAHEEARRKLSEAFESLSSKVLKSSSEQFLKLANENFLRKADRDVVQRERDRLAESEAQIQNLEAALAALG